MKLAVSILLFILMALLTANGYTATNTYFFAGGSMASLMSVAALPAAVPTTLLAIFGVLLYFYLRRDKRIKLAYLAVVMVLWFLSGRTIGTILYPNGQVVTGWFYIATDKFLVCNQKTDCETTIGYRTKTESLSLWRIHIKNDSTDKEIFVGPFLWHRTVHLFGSNFGAGKYTR
jgi:hypothetical protein